MFFILINGNCCSNLAPARLVQNLVRAHLAQSLAHQVQNHHRVLALVNLAQVAPAQNLAPARLVQNLALVLVNLVLALLKPL